MELGFKAADGFDRGVPMIPKPKSEAWLICALKEDSPYSFCDRLEETLPGNDDSPNSAKMQLAEILLAKGKSTSDLAEMVMNQEIHPDRIDMPSFNSFRQRLELVAREMIRS
ncbi:hypothetical protein KQI84_17390 [bacterium]|nr:hypothetical protein [bacterium]